MRQLAGFEPSISQSVVMCSTAALLPCTIIKFPLLFPKWYLTMYIRIPTLNLTIICHVFYHCATATGQTELTLFHSLFQSGVLLYQASLEPSISQSVVMCSTTVLLPLAITVLSMLPLLFPSSAMLWVVGFEPSISQSVVRCSTTVLLPLAITVLSMLPLLFP